MFHSHAKKTGRAINKLRPSYARCGL